MPFDKVTALTAVAATLSSSSAAASVLSTSSETATGNNFSNMKRSITLLLLSMTAASSLVLAHKLETKRREEAVEDDDHEVEKELEEELEAEMSGFKEERHLGFHILDEDSNIIISEPTDRILRLLGPDRDPDGHILSKIKDLYGKRLSAEHSARNSHSANTNINFIEMLAREQDANKKSNGEQDSFIKHLISMVF